MKLSKKSQKNRIIKPWWKSARVFYLGDARFCLKMNILLYNANIHAFSDEILRPQMLKFIMG